MGDAVGLKEIFALPNQSHTGSGAQLTDMVIVGQTYSGTQVKIPLTNCVGIGFEFYGANLREKFEGQMVVISKSVHAWKDLWPWFMQIQLHLALGYVIWNAIGPLCAAFVIGLLVNIGNNINRVNSQLLRNSVATFGLLIFSWFQLEIVGILNILINFTHVVFFVSADSFIEKMVASTIIALATICLLLLFITTYRSKVGEIDKGASAYSQRARMAYVFEFNQEQSIYLIELRRQIVTLPEHKHLVCSTWISNRYLEYFLSLLLPDFVYNSRRLRHWILIFSEFVVPIVAFLQGASVLIPWTNTYFVSLWNLVKSDLLCRCLLHLISSQRIRLLLQWVVTTVKEIFRFLHNTQVVEFLSRLKEYLGHFHYWVIYFGSRLPFTTLIGTMRTVIRTMGRSFIDFVRGIIGFVANSTLRWTIGMVYNLISSLVSNILMLFRFGRRTPEHMALLARRVGETGKMIWDKCKNQLTKHRRQTISSKSAIEDSPLFVTALDGFIIPTSPPFRPSKHFKPQNQSTTATLPITTVTTNTSNAATDFTGFPDSPNFSPLQSLRSIDLSAMVMTNSPPPFTLGSPALKSPTYESVESRYLCSSPSSDIENKLKQDEERDILDWIGSSK